MQMIWKFPLEPECEIEMPMGSQILSVHAQGANVCLWALVQMDAKPEIRRFFVFATGQPVPMEPLKFIGTVLIQSGSLVFHVFERE